MPRTKSLSKYIYDLLADAGWPDLEIDESKSLVTCPLGKILSKRGRDLYLNFFYYSQDNSEYSEQDEYFSLVFPQDFDPRNYLYFRQRTGYYKLNYYSVFKNIINPLGKEVKKIKINSEGSNIRVYRSTLSIPEDSFRSAMADAHRATSIADSYKNSTRNYWANQYSKKYSSNTRKRTTYLKKGEFNFLVDKLYLKTKKRNKDYQNYLNSEDIKSLEEMTIQFLKHEVFSQDFVRFLDDYFIKEKLEEVIEIGRQILALRTEKTDTIAAKKVIQMISDDPINQFEGIWQKYFEKYLLYLIFTYKKIFSKVELENIKGEKKYPDFIGINHYNGLDVIEIKTHLKNILVWDRSHKNFYFSPEMSKAIVQTNNYLDAIIQRRFQESEDERKITNSVDEENLYHPRGIIIISSTEKITTKEGKEDELNRDFTKLRNSLQNITILTFDEVLGIAGEYIKNIVPDQVED